MSRFSSIDPVGILNACTTKVRMNSARITAMTIDSKYSRSVDFLNRCSICSEPLAPSPSPLAIRIRSHLQHGKERFLRDLHLPDLLHALLAFLLLLEELALAGDVAAVALGEHVLAHRLDRFPRDDAAADRGLNRHFEHLPRNQLAHLRRERTAPLVGHLAVNDRREGIDRIA